MWRCGLAVAATGAPFCCSRQVAPAGTRSLAEPRFFCCGSCVDPFCTQARLDLIILGMELPRELGAL